MGSDRIQSVVKQRGAENNETEALKERHVKVEWARMPPPVAKVETSKAGGPSG